MLCDAGALVSLERCHAGDCSLAAADRAALRGLAATSATLAAPCEFAPDCGTTRAYTDPGAWGSCSESCWAHNAGAAQPIKERSVGCEASFDGSSGTWSEPLAACEAAGAGAPPPASELCNMSECERSACTVRPTTVQSYRAAFGSC